MRNLVCAIILIRASIAAGADIPATPFTDKLPPFVLHVAPNGNDTWTGTRVMPLATPEGARDALRKYRKEGKIKKGAAVLIHAGTYELARPLQLAAEDSGTEKAPVIYRAFQNEKPVLLGGRRIKNFKPFKGEILQTDVSAQGFKGVRFRQLYMDGRRQTPARYPNIDPARPRTGGWAFLDGKPFPMYQNLPPEQETKRNLAVRPDDLRTWAHPEDGEVNVYPRYNWSNCIVPIASLDREKRILTLAQDATRELRPLNRYYVRGLFEELDSPGEWYLDPRSEVLYFWPPADMGGPINKARVYAPLVENVIVMSNTEHIEIRGLTIECCEGSGVLLRNAKQCRVAACIVRSLGGHTAGIEIRKGGNNSVFGNDIYDAGSYGVYVEAGDTKTLVPADHNVENNYIHHVGLLNGHGCGICLRGVGNRAANNLIHDTARCGIFGIGNDNIIEYNRIRHTNLDTDDTGGIYICAGQEGWMRRGFIIRHNFITDTLGFGCHDGKWKSPYNSFGIYLDDAISEVTVYGNIVARAAFSGAFIHGGRDNTIENNVLVDGSRGQMTWTGSKPPDTLEPQMREKYKDYKDSEVYRTRYPKFAALNPETDGPMGGNRFMRNILFYRDPEPNLYVISNYLSDKNACDYNLIWSGGSPIWVDILNSPPKQTFEEWQKLGNDTHSVIADPLFVNPDQDNYRLKPDSPAMQLGFQPIPVDKIGPYAHPLRATWPIVAPPGVRETPFESEVPAPIP